MAFNIQKAVVVWKWHEIYRGLASSADAFIESLLDDMRTSKLPNTTFTITQLKVGLISGGRREYVEINAEHLKDCRIFAAARPYGKHLSVSMFLAYTPGFWGRKSLNTFEYQDLEDFLESVQISIKKAKDRIAQDAKIDPKDLKTEFEKLPLQVEKGKKKK
jgi:hypothetical protein